MEKFPSRDGPVPQIGEPVAVSRGQRAFQWFLAWIPAIAAVVVTLRMQPFFGNMDDGRYVPLAGSYDPLAFASALFDPQNGFIRWFSWIVIWPASWLGDRFGAETYFVTNILVSTGCIAVFGYAYSRFSKWQQIWLFPLFMGLALAWPYTAELFFFPSLQEKAVILGAAILLLWIVALDRLRVPWLHVALLIPTTALAFTTKTQILVFIPGLLAALWISRSSANKPADFWIRVTATVLWIAASLGLVIVAISGSYSSSTQGDIDASFLQDRRFQLLSAVLIVYLPALIVRAVMKSVVAGDFVPAVLLLSMCGAFVVWDIRNYYLAVASVMVAGALTSLVSWLKITWLSFVAAVLAALLAIAWLVLRLPQVYASLASVGQFLQSESAKDLSSENSTILVSCLEAPNHYNEYAVRFDLSGIDFLFAEAGQKTLLDVSTYVLADSRLCPWPPSIPRDGWEPVWTSRYGSQAYALYKR